MHGHSGGCSSDDVTEGLGVPEVSTGGRLSDDATRAFDLNHARV